MKQAGVEAGHGLAAVEPDGRGTKDGTGKRLLGSVTSLRWWLYGLLYRQMSGWSMAMPAGKSA